MMYLNKNNILVCILFCFVGCSNYKKEFALAIHNGNLKEVKFLINENKVNIDSPCYKGLANTPLMIAAKMNRQKVVKYLSDMGASIDLKDTDGYTALFWAVDNNHFETTSTLLEYGASPNIISNNGTSLLISAISNENLEILKLLFENKIKVNFIIKNIGLTPLDYAVESNQEKIVSLLLKHGAKINSINTKSMTPLDTAFKNLNNRKLKKMKVTDAEMEVAIANASKIIDLLRKHGAETASELKSDSTNPSKPQTP